MVFGILELSICGSIALLEGISFMTFNDLTLTFLISFTHESFPFHTEIISLTFPLSIN